MKDSILLRHASLLSIFFALIHITGDIIYGFEKGGASNLIVLPILTIWSYAALVLTERKWGYIVILMGSLLGLAIPVVHMMGSGIGEQVEGREGAFLFVWTTIALGITSTFSIMLSLHGLWQLVRRPNTMT